MPESAPSETRWALVTGGAVRIGAAICRGLATRGFGVLIHCRSSREEAEALARELVEGGGKAAVVQSDLSSGSGCEDLMREVVAVAGHVELLVNNAAVFTKSRLSALDAPALLAEFWPNLFAPILLTRAFAAQTDSGHVVNVTDRRVASIDPACAAYWLTKRALADFTLLSARELAPRIRVNAIAPGAILPPPGEGEAYMDRHAPPGALDHRCTPADIVSALNYLLDSPFVTGQTLFVDSGQHVKG